MTPQARFDDFLVDIEPSATTKSAASDAQKGLREHLQKDPEFKQVLRWSFLSGSYARDTAIRPQTVDGVLKRPDVDVIVVTNHTMATPPEEVVDLLYRRLKVKYPDIRRQNRSVRVFTTKADMDVVPIIAPWSDSGPYYIPDRKVKGWLETNPPKHTSWTVEVNKKADGRFKPLVKLFKWWRRENPTVNKKPKGFVLECLAADCMSYTEKHWGLLFTLLLEAIVRKHNRYSVPWITDPGVTSNSVTNGLSAPAWEGFYKKVEEHAKLAREATDEDDLDRANDLWRRIFGDRFPAEPARSSSASRLLRPAASFSGGLAFPSTPIQPRKPGGFA